MKAGSGCRVTGQSTWLEAGGVVSSGLPAAASATEGKSPGRHPATSRAKASSKNIGARNFMFFTSV
jgi:hypothetical protein